MNCYLQNNLQMFIILTKLVKIWNSIANNKLWLYVFPLLFNLCQHNLRGSFYYISKRFTYEQIYYKYIEKNYLYIYVSKISIVYTYIDNKKFKYNF